VVIITVIPAAEAEPHLDKTSKSDASIYFVCINDLYEYVKKKCVFD
jgi:hypothetical protein